MKWPKLKRDHEGLYVKTLVPIKNGWCTIAPGTICRVARARGGLTLISEPCKLCSVRVDISRVPYEKVKLIKPTNEKRATCHECGVKEGQTHQRGCDMERCPFCGGQLITCSCSYIKLGFDYIEPVWDYSIKSWSPENHPTAGLPKDIYENGLTEELTEKWHHILEKKGRVPYIQYPNICGKCGKLWPEMFSVPDEEWKKYIRIRERDKMLCRPCYNQIKEWIDNPNKE